MAEQHHKYTGILLIVFSLLILLGAIFFTVSQLRVMDTDEYKNGEHHMQTAKNNLLVAYILGYIAAGMGIVLAILYFGHVTWGISSEIPHTILFILLFLLVVVSGIFGFIALNNIDNSSTTDNKGSTGWIWAAEIAGLIAIIVIIISGAWRAQYRASDKDLTVTKVTTDKTPSYIAPPVAKPSETQLTISGPSHIVAGSSPAYTPYSSPVASRTYSSSVV